MKSWFLFLALAWAAVSPASNALNDAEIAAIVVVANQVDVDAGRLAATFASREEVRKFGQLMVDDHAGVGRAAVELVEKLGVTPVENPTSRELRAAGESNVATLVKLDGPAFDRSYIAQEVAYHEQVIEALDDTLIPNAENEELKALLVRVRPAFVAHLEHARRLRSQLAEE